MPHWYDSLTRQSKWSGMGIWRYKDIAIFQGHNRVLFLCPAGTIRYPSKWGWVASQVGAPLIVYNLFPSGSEEAPSSMHCLHNLSPARISFISVSSALNKQFSSKDFLKSSSGRGSEINQSDQHHSSIAATFQNSNSSANIHNSCHKGQQGPFTIWQYDEACRVPGDIFKQPLRQLT